MPAPSTIFEIRKKSNFPKNIVKQNAYHSSMLGPAKRRSKWRPNSSCRYDFCTFQKFEFQQKRNEKSSHPRPRCQIDCVPEPAKFQLSLRFLIIFFHVLAAQVPCGSVRTPVACGPHCPRPKDCPGLGYPNTFKLRKLIASGLLKGGEPKFNDFERDL